MMLLRTTVAALALALGGLWPTSGAAQTPARAQVAAEPATEAASTIYLVRHTETVDDDTADPALSQAGEARADRLARMLSGAGLTALHTTDYQRTRATAEAVAAVTALEPREYDPRDLQTFADALRAEAGRHLVVGHSNTTPALVQLLGGDPGGAIPEDEYGRIYQLTLTTDGVHTAILGYPGGYLTNPPPTGVAPEARPGDVDSPEAVVAALYDVISGPAGEARDWDRLRSLFLPSARMVPVQRSTEGHVSHRAMTVEDYVQGSGPVIEEIGFTERELARRIDRFGDVAHVFSTYEGTRAGSDEPFLRGLNSIQLIHDGARWWISSLAWSAERPDLPIPPRYLP